MGTKKLRLIFPTQSPDRLGPSLLGPVDPNEGSNERVRNANIVSVVLD